MSETGAAPSAWAQAEATTHFHSIAHLVEGLAHYHGSMTYPDMVLRLTELTEALLAAREDVARALDAARAEEREACAKVADEHGPADNANDAPELFYLAATITAKQIAAALRARGEEAAK